MQNTYHSSVFLSKKSDKSDKLSAYMQLHFSVFLWGFTAILGELIEMPAAILVWWRVLITVISLFILLRISKSVVQDLKHHKVYFLIGVCIALHWICFYGSIKYANASIALICMATSSFFTSLIEPIVVSRKLSLKEIIFGLLVLPGMYFIVDSTELDMQKGIWVGLAAAFLAALFTSYNKKYIVEGKETEISYLELRGALVFLSFLVPIMIFQMDISIIPSTMDSFYLIVLALICTTLPFVLSMKALNKLSAFTSTLIVNLEPVYGIVLAALLLGQHKELDPRFYLGVILILAVVLLFPLVSSRNKKTNYVAE